MGLYVWNSNFGFAVYLWTRQFYRTHFERLVQAQCSSSDARIVVELTGGMLFSAIANE